MSFFVKSVELEIEKYSNYKEANKMIEIALAQPNKFNLSAEDKMKLVNMQFEIHQLV